MKLSQLFESFGVKAGCIPYVLDANGEPRMAFMVSSDEHYGGPDPMIAKGGVDPGESTQQAGIREAQEELGLRTTNIVDGTIELGWAGEITGMDSTYRMEVFICRVGDLVDFDTPHYETKEVVWLTEKEFNNKGRRSHRKIVTHVAEKIIAAGDK